MKTLKIISSTTYTLVAILGYIFAFVYLLRPEFMPYHSEATGLHWNEVDPSFQVLIIALMRVAGGGWLATALAITFLLVARKTTGQNWFSLALILVAMAALVPSLYATLYVRANSPANPPWIAALIGICLLIVGLVLEYISRSARNKE